MCRGNPFWLPFLGIVMFFYFLLQYAQYHTQEGGLLCLPQIFYSKKDVIIISFSKVDGKTDFSGYL